MAKNISRVQRIQRSRKGFFANLDKLFNMDKILGGEFPWHQFKYFVWIGGLIVLYIGSSLSAENLIYTIDTTKAELEEIRADYTTQEADFMKRGKQSEIIREMKRRQTGLQENKTPPTKIIVED